MIKKFYLQGFKSFAEPTEFDLDDLLIIAGSNSGGKSSIIQALLLLSQTLENTRSDVVLDLAGNYIQFAEFSEAVHGRPDSSDAKFTIGFDIDVIDPDFESSEVLEYLFRRRSSIGTSLRYARESHLLAVNPINIRITFASDRSGKPIVQEASYTKTIHKLGEVSLSLRREKRSKYLAWIHLTPLSSDKNLFSAKILKDFEQLIAESEPIILKGSNRLLYDRYFHEPFARFGFTVGDIPEIGANLEKLFQSFGNRKIDQDRMSQILSDILRFTFQEGVISEVSGKLYFNHFFFPSTMEDQGLEEDTVLFDKSLYKYVRFFDFMFGGANRVIRRFFRNIRYIGPLRAKPERAYLSIGSPIDIGNAGENAVPILWLHQNDKVSNKTIIGSEPHERRLVLAVQDWLQEFGIAYAFHITKPKRVIYQAELESAQGSNTMVTIADVGFGVSQLLPVIIAGLRAPEGSTLILEQPEIHLHPRLQGKLADFLICMVELGKQVIVETHSEHLINMLRLRIIQDKTGELQKKIGIIFVRSSQQLSALPKVKGSQEKQGSFVEKLKVDEYGKIINWPPDFFPETTSINEEILKAMMDKFTGEN